MSRRADAERAHRWRQHALAEVEGGAREPARIDEERTSVRQDRERRVSLTDVEEHHPQRAGGADPASRGPASISEAEIATPHSAARTWRRQISTAAHDA